MKRFPSPSGSGAAGNMRIAAPSKTPRGSWTIQLLKAMGPPATSHLPDTQKGNRSEPASVLVCGGVCLARVESGPF